MFHVHDTPSWKTYQGVEGLLHVVNKKNISPVRIFSHCFEKGSLTVNVLDLTFICCAPCVDLDLDL